MQPEVGQFTPYAANTLVKLMTDVEGLKFIENQWVNHTLPSGTLAFITEHVLHNTRTSINTDPLSSDDFGYKLKSTVTETFIHDEFEEPIYEALKDPQKIRHAALNTKEYPPSGPKGMYKVDELTRILPGHEFKYRRGSSTVTLREGDLIRIKAKGTTKTGSSSVMIANNAYYLQVQKVKRSMVPRQIAWRSKRSITAANFEIVKGDALTADNASI